MNVINWITANWELIGVVLGIVLGAVEVVRATGNLRQGILALMLRAEKSATKGELGPVNGDYLMTLVVQLTKERVVPRLPAYVRPFITEAMVRKVAAWLYNEAKRYLENGHLLPPVMEPAAGGEQPPTA